MTQSTVRFAAMNLRAHLITDNTVLRKFATLSKRRERFWSGPPKINFTHAGYHKLTGVLAFYRNSGCGN